MYAKTGDKRYATVKSRVYNNVTIAEANRLQEDDQGQDLVHRPSALRDHGVLTRRIYFQRCCGDSWSINKADSPVFKNLNDPRIKLFHRDLLLVYPEYKVIINCKKKYGGVC